MSRRWAKMPGPGQFRGEGEWTDVTETCLPSEWERIRMTGYLPTRIQDEKPAPDDGDDLQTIGKE